MSEKNEKKPEKRKKGLLDFLGSIPLAIVLLIVIGILAFVGTLIPQADTFSPDELMFYNGAHPAVAMLNRLVSSFQIADRDPWRSSIYGIYHSWWFVAVIILLAVNLTVCSILRVGGLKHYFRRFDGKIPTSSSVEFNGKYNLSKDDIVKITRGWNPAGYRSRDEKETSDGYAFRLQRGRMGRLGYIIVHFGILLVIIGAMISALTREKGFVWLRQGEETDRYFSRTSDMELPLGYKIRADHLRQVMYENGKSVKDWFSELTIIKDGKEVLKKTIEVNDPLIFEGRSFYQAAWNFGYRFTLKIEDKKTGESAGFPLSVGNDLLNTEGPDKTYSFNNGKVYFRLGAFYPDFIITNEGFATRSQELNNPTAVLLVYWEGLKEARRKVVFLKVPEMDFEKMHPKGDFGSEPFKFSIDKNIAKINVTGLEVSMDKGTDMVYFGFYFVIAGVFFSFYLNHRRIWILVTAGRSYCDVKFSGSAHRNKQVFKKDAEKLFKEFETLTGKTGGHKKPASGRKKG